MPISEDQSLRPAVLITGGAKRIGAIIAQTFADHGWHVVIHFGNSQTEAEALAAQLPSAECVQCDLSDSQAAVQMVEALAERLPNWCLLINSAAVFKPDTAEALDPSIFAEAVRVNAETPTRMTQSFFAHARAKQSRCAIQLTDQKLLNTNPDFFSYTMAKNAFNSTIRMIAMASDRVDDRIYGLAPGAMLPSHDQHPPEHELSGRMNLLQRLTDPQELADASLFLAKGWLASGETLYIDSGQHILSQARDVLYLAREE